MGVAMSMGVYSSCYNSYLSAQNEQLQNPYGSEYNKKYPNGPTVSQAVNPGTGTSLTPTPGATQASYTNYYQYQPLFTTTEVIEVFYNVQLNKWASVKPYAQLIINPAGTNSVHIDLILGVRAKVTF